ncbi:hypothetical protein [Streptomyces sp. NBC_01716]|uniref:hypothetical protein n=1 Tax=Streptomyces sp. NBC_01716 TaxID=2975917 RepID=UPI002E347EA1|nr:hypothetical protein [Streptomyces sp. NBC_01716]
MSRKFSQMETPEQQYARRNAGHLAQIANRQASRSEREAERHQMDVDVYGRQGRDYSDPQAADRAAKTRDKHLSRAARLRDDAARQERLATPPKKPKRRWL